MKPFLVLLVLLLTGCQSQQALSPTVPVTKDVTPTIFIENSRGVTINLHLHYKQKTDVELGGGNTASPQQKQDVSPNVEIPALP